MTNLTNDIAINNFEIYDFNEMNDFKDPKLSYIQLDVNILYKESSYNLSLITSLTYDLSAVSMSLTLDKDSTQYFSLINDLMNANDIDMETAEELLDDYIDSVIEITAQDLFNNYVYSNYEVNDYH